MTILENDTLGFGSVERFYRAHARARRSDFAARLGGKPSGLLPFDALASVLRAYEVVRRPEPQLIPLDKIVGSVGRYNDFTRDFLPKNPGMAARWARVDSAMLGDAGVPPIEVYALGDVYFVADGNHRVSVARANGFREIEAYVTEIPVTIDLKPGDSLDEAIIKAERARFLAETNLAAHVQRLDVHFTRPGGYVRLLKLIELHRRLMIDDPETEGEVTLERAAQAWYWSSYLPTIQTIRERGILSRFAGRTAADLYVWIWGYIFDAHQRFGEEIDPDEAVSMLEIRPGESSFNRAINSLMTRLAEISGLSSEGSEVPDWVTQSFDWDDGTLSDLGAEPAGGCMTDQPEKGEKSEETKKPPAGRLLLIRHGMNDFVASGRLAGRAPGVHLNDAGRLQATALADRLAEAPIVAVYCSPLERAVETAEPLARRLGLELQCDDSLLETDYGEWAGQKLSELMQTDLWRQVQICPSASRFPSGESLRDTQSRMVETLERIRERHKHEVVAIVSHSDPIKLAVAHYTGMPMDLFQRLEVAPASITEIELHELRPRLLRLNDCAHVPPQPPEVASAEPGVEDHIEDKSPSGDAGRT